MEKNMLDRLSPSWILLQKFAGRDGWQDRYRREAFSRLKRLAAKSLSSHALSKPFQSGSLTHYTMLSSELASWQNGELGSKRVVVEAKLFQWIVMLLRLPGKGDLLLQLVHIRFLQMILPKGICHDFTCWREVWELGPLAATTLRASNHHVHGCHMKQTCPQDYLDFLCPHCGLVLLQPLREHDSHLERHSDCTQSIHSSDTGESVESLGEGRVYRKVPVSYFTHGSRIMLDVSHHPNMLPDYASDNEEMRREREQARTEECSCDLPVYGQYKGFFKLGIKSTCQHCTSSIDAGVLYGGYDAGTDRFTCCFFRCGGG